MNRIVLSNKLETFKFSQLINMNIWEIYQFSYDIQNELGGNYKF